MRVLVTGSSGFIGPHLVHALRARGDYVIGIDRDPPASIAPDVFVQGDLLDDGPLNEASQGIDYVAHLAAARTDWGLPDAAYIRDNVRATRRLIEVGRQAGIRKWLVYSSVGVLGSSAEPLDDSAPIAPEGIYASSKAEAEALFEQLGADDPLAEITILRPSAVYGPGNPPNTNVYRLLDAIHRRRFVMIGDGQNIKTVSYLPNLIEVTMFLADRMSPGVHTHIYVDTPALTTRALVEHLHEALGKNAPRWHIPISLARSLAFSFDILARIINVDLPITSARIQKFCRSTNFDGVSLREAGFSAPVATEDALHATARWYLETQTSA